MVMHARSEHIVRLVAFALIAWGLWVVLQEYRRILLALRFGILSPNNHFWAHVLYLTYTAILPIAAIISGYGLFQFRRWGRLSSLIISSLLLVSNLYGALWFVVISYQLQNNSPTPIPAGSAVHYVDFSMWPTWITGLGSGLITYMLLRASVKTICSRY
jgi:hypothetical protein